VATIGPASESKKILQKMADKGMNVARLNFSHGYYAWHRKVIKNIRELGKKIDKPVGIMADLQGPRIRVDSSQEVRVRKGEVISVVLNAKKKPKAVVKTGKYIMIHLPAVGKYLKKGSSILIEDGLIALKVISKEGNLAVCRAVNSGIIKPHKGVNIPSISSRLGAMTKKDERDLKFAISQGVDFIALSFVSSAKDITSLRRKIKKLLNSKSLIPQIIAKIETKKAVENFDSILEETDIVMVARGDLGIEIPETKVPVFQKEIAEKCLRTAKPVVVATQMLNSMIDNLRPTRAEVSDVSNAVIDHVDAVMLSGETANGKHPVESVSVMSNIIKETEKSPFDDLVHGFLGDKKISISAAVADASHEMAKNSDAKAIIAASLSGLTARMVARHRPDQKLIVMTNNIKTYQQLSIIWGVESYILSECKNLDQLIDKSIKEIKKRKILKKGDKVIIITGRPHIKKEHVSLIKIEEIR
ncbi:MAG TPA: pyruvate kinase, partial [Candidatus Moranbacteria bacterium]|nr:pyruvate kinase [Candidatus Moranbacteria bacterium]